MLNFGFRKFKLGAMFGIPVYLDWSTIFLALMFLQSGDIVFAVGLAVILLASIVLHELGHSLTARCFGCETRDITLTVIGGCASLERMPRKAWQEFLVSAAGPATSFVLGIILFVAALYLTGDNLLGILLYCGAQLNIGLGLFNLLPGFPMDGGRIFRSVASFFTSRAKATHAAMIVGRVFAVMLGLHGLHSVASGDGRGVIPVLIAWMIWREGYREYQLARMEESAYGGWGGWSARVSPPPYGGDDDEVEIRKDS